MRAHLQGVTGFISLGRDKQKVLCLKLSVNTISIFIQTLVMATRVSQRQANLDITRFFDNRKRIVPFSSSQSDVGRARMVTTERKMKRFNAILQQRTTEAIPETHTGASSFVSYITEKSVPSQRPCSAQRAGVRRPEEERSWMLTREPLRRPRCGGEGGSTLMLGA